MIAPSGRPWRRRPRPEFFRLRKNFLIAHSESSSVSTVPTRAFTDGAVEEIAGSGGEWHGAGGLRAMIEEILETIVFATEPESSVRDYGEDGERQGGGQAEASAYRWQPLGFPRSAAVEDQLASHPPGLRLATTKPRTLRDARARPERRGRNPRLARHCLRAREDEFGHPDHAAAPARSSPWHE